MKSILSLVLLSILLIAAAVPAAAEIPATPGSHSLVITQFSVTGNNSATTSPYAIDYIEIFNAGPVAVDLQNWTIQYQSGTSTSSFGGSGTYPIGSLDPYKSGSAYGPNGNGTYPAYQITYSAAAQTALNCRPAQAGEYTQHCFLQPGQYLLVQVQTNNTTAGNNKGYPFPLTVDLDLTASANIGSIAAKSDGTQNNWIGGTGANAGIALKPSPSAGKFLLSNGVAGNPACNPAASSGGNPTRNTSLFGGYSDFVGYYSGGNPSNCWEGPSSTQQLVYANPNPNGPAYLGGGTSPDNKNKLANVRMAKYDGTFPPTASIDPCSDSDNNMVDFGRLVIGPPAGGGATNWILHNSSRSYDVTNGDKPFTAVPCPNVVNTVAPATSGLLATASPVEVVANTATPVSLAVTVSDGGANPTSAVFGVTADLSGVQGLVETALGTTPQVFGYVAPDTFDNPQYSFPAPASTTTMTVNAPLADVGKTYTIPIKVVDDAYRTVTTSISLKVVGSTPGTASLSAVPPSMPATVPTDVDLIAAITDPGAHPTGTSFTVTMDLSAVGGGNAVTCPEVSTDAFTCHTTVTADISKVGGSYTIPVTIVDDQGRNLTLTPATIELAVSAQPEPVAVLAWNASSTGNFGSVTQGVTSSSIQTATLTNTGLAALAFTSAVTDNSDFAATNNCPATLAPNASCTITITFTPSLVGPRTGTLTVTDDSHLQAGSQQTLSLSGNGTPPPPTADLSSPVLSFGGQLALTSSSAQTVTLKNNGGLPLTISRIDWAGANIGEFSHSTTCLSSLAAGSSCTFTLTFSPTTTGAKVATLSITDNATGSPHSVSITGEGTDFPVSPATGGSTSATIVAGQTATYNLQIAPAGPFTGTVTLNCPTALQAATCTVSPTSVNITSAGALPVTVTIKTSPKPTTAAGLTAPGGPGGSNLPLSVACTIVLGAIVAFSVSKKARQQWRYAAVCCALLCAMGMTACQGLKTSAWPDQPALSTPAGTYPVTLTATYGTVVRTTSLTLTVN